MKSLCIFANTPPYGNYISSQPKSRSFIQLTLHNLYKTALMLTLLLTLGFGKAWGEEVKLVSLGTEAISSIGGKGTAPTYLGTAAEPAVYSSADDAYSVAISTTFSTAQSSEYKPDGLTKYKDYYYSISAALDMTLTPESLTNYVKVAATNCKISKIVLRAVCTNTTTQPLPAVGFEDGLPETTTLGSKSGRIASVIIDDLSAPYSSTKVFSGAEALTYTFSTNCSEVYFSKQIKQVGLSSATSFSNIPSSSQTSGIFGIDVYVVPTTSYEITYNANGGSGTMESTINTIAANGFTAPTGQAFEGWNTASDGSGTSYAAGATAPSDLTLYAQWSTAYTVTYALNGGEGVAPTETDKSAGAVFTLAEAATRTGYRFAGWKCSADETTYSAEADYTMTAANTTFTAQWKLITQQVIYSWEGGSPATEVGGSAVTKAQDGSDAATTDINVDAVGTNATYKTIKLQGKISSSAWSGNYIQITTTEAVKTGDKISITACTTKGDATKKGSAQMRAGTSATSTAIFTDDGTYNDIKVASNVPEPNTKTFTVPAGISTSTLTMTRSQSSTNCWITKLLITREKEVAEDDVRTVTFDSNGGSTVASAAVESGDTVAQPANPTKEHARFNGWKLNGAAYDFSTAVTANITLVADWTQLYTITYAGGDGTGTAPTEDDKAAAETFTVADNTFTAPEGKEFDKWNDGTGDYDEGDTYTVGTANVTLTAQWKTMSDKYTVKYMDSDGTTPLGADELVNVGAHPTAEGITTAKDFYTFNGWKLSGTATTLDAVSAAVGATVTLVADYTGHYATSMNIEKWVLDNRQNNLSGFKAALDAKNYTYADLNALDTLNDNKSNRNYAYLGIKVNKASSKISFLLKNGSTVNARFGNMGNNVNVIIGAADPVALTSSDYANSTAASDKVYSYTATADVVVSFQSTGTSTVVFKQIMIDEDIAAVTLPYIVTYDAGSNGTCATESAVWTGAALVLPTVTPNSGYTFDGWNDGTDTYAAGAEYTPTANITLHAQYGMDADNRLDSLSFNGAPLEGFDPDVNVYYTTVPYSATVPAITAATAKDAAATVTIQATTWDEENGYYIAQAYVTPAGGGANKFYQVRFTMDPKEGVSIIRVATTGGTNKTVTGIYAGSGDVNLSSTKKMDSGKYIGFTLEGTTLQAGDIINVYTSTAANTGGSHIIFYDNMDDKNELYDTGEIGGEGKNLFVINAAMVGRSTIYLYRSNADDAHRWNGYVDYIEVLRDMNPIITSFSINDIEATIDDSASPKTITLEVPFSTDITALTPEVEALANGGATVTPTGAQNFSAGAVDYTVTSAYAETTTYKVTVNKTAASSDATLSALSVEGYSLSPAFSADIITYDVELDKGTTIGDLPTISYTCNHSGAQAVKTDATTLPGNTAIIVTAEDGTTKTYTIRFTVSASTKVVIFDGATDDAVRTSPQDGVSWTITGFSSIAAQSVTVNNKTYTKKLPTGGSTSSSRYLQVVIPEGYQARFYIVHNTNSGGSERKAFIATTATRTVDETIYAAANSVANTPTYGTSNIVQAGTYYINADNSINFFEISLTLTQLSESPTISADPTDLNLCSFGESLSVTASVSDGGTLSYQWYKVVAEGDDTAVGTNSASYIPSAAGTYYVVVTNTTAGRPACSKTSEQATVTMSAMTSITAVSYAKGSVGDSKTMSVTADGSNLTYEWKACDAEGNANGAVLSTTDSYEVTITDAVQYFKVTVSGDCGAAVSEILRAEVWAAVERANVTSDRTWDWSALTCNSDVSFAGQTDEVLAANISSAVPNTDDFRSDMLLCTGQHFWRSGNKFFQGSQIRFYSELPGKVQVWYRSTGSNKSVTVTINGTKAGSNSTSSFTASTQISVPAGWVTIVGSGETLTRIQKIVFDTDYEVARESLVVNEIGTFCSDKAVTGFTGVQFYELAGGLGTQGHPSMIIFNEVDHLIAGMPYLFVADKEKMQVVYNEDDVTLTAGHYNGFYGTFETIYPASAETPNELYGNFMIINGTIAKCGAYCGLYAYRGYIKIDEVPCFATKEECYNAAGADGTQQQQGNVQRRRVVLTNSSVDQATGIDYLTEQGISGAAAQGCYDVLGRSITEPQQSGVYIQNCKKVIIVR